MSQDIQQAARFDGNDDALEGNSPLRPEHVILFRTPPK
jgi:hypothetical protein